MADRLVLETPTRCRLPESWASGPVADFLRYEDSKVAHELRVWQEALRADTKASQRPGHRPHWFVAKYGRDALVAKVEALKSARWRTCLQRDDDGPWTYSGLAPTLAEKFGGEVVVAYQVPELRPARYAGVELPFPLRPFQADTVDEALRHAVSGPAGAEIATGLGKTVLAFELVRRVGLPTVITTPSLSIAGQFYRQATKIFGAGEVGRLYESKKEIGKHILIAVTASVHSAKGAVAENLCRRGLLIGDESHTWGAETLSEDVFGVLADIPYRVFLSGSQTRNDGSEILLEGVLGRVFKTVTVRDGVAMGYLARPRFVQVQTLSPLPATRGTTVELNRTHLYGNEVVADKAASLARLAVSRGFRPLIAVKELNQFRLLEPRLRGLRVALAHADKTLGSGENRDWMPEQYRKSDPAALVEALDRGDYDLMVGTSCVGVGTDFQTVDYIIDLVGDSSEIRIRQLVGRGTRTAGGKKEFYYVSFDVKNVDALHRAAEKQRAIFEEIYGPVIVAN